MSSIHPYYRKPKIGPYHVIRSWANPSFDDNFVDLRYVHLSPSGEEDALPEAIKRFDARTAEYVRAALGDIRLVQLGPVPDGNPFPAGPLLKLKEDNDRNRNIPTVRSLAALAYLEYFPYDKSDAARALQARVCRAILMSEPSYCGSVGKAAASSKDLPFILGALDQLDNNSEGNYDLDLMHLLQIAYRYYDTLSVEAREYLITVLLAAGRIDRTSEAEINTSGGPPVDWSRAGHITILTTVLRIGETENHILQIHTARYLANQLLYQRDHDINHDNRRNGFGGAPTCTGLMLRLLRSFLRDDFSEYNAKSYQTETRNALRNLCSYAYDHEVRLGARMVLDYLSAHRAVSSCDLRRVVPFRRINKGANTQLLDKGYMDVSLLEWETGCDHAAEQFLVQTGQTRAYERASPPGSAWMKDDHGNAILRPWAWSVRPDAKDGLLEGLGDYRIPAPIHDLFVNDLHRRFYQVLHRTPQADVESGQNVDNREIFAGSPSYLISAGGSPAGEAISTGLAHYIDPSKRRLQLGVAVTTTFMPTGQSAGPDTQNYTKDLIQFSSFSEIGPAQNYGVAPDFACGHQVHLPDWCIAAIETDNNRGNFSFVDKHNGLNMPGFYLAIFRSHINNFALLEAHDTWLHPELSFNDFRAGVWRRNARLVLINHFPATYVTTNENTIHFVIWDDTAMDDRVFGASVSQIDYARTEDRPEDAGDRFLSGTIMNSPAEAKVVISNPSLGQHITLDWSDSAILRRTSETGFLEEAGAHNEVWVDFDWRGEEEGDFFHPFRTVAGAAARVANNGVVKIVPGSTRERPFLARGKNIRFEAAIGGVVIGTA